MNFQDSTVQAAIIGGIVAILGSVFAAVFGWIRWNLERKKLKLEIDKLQKETNLVVSSSEKVHQKTNEDLGAFDDTPPDHYDFDYLKVIIASKFGKQAGFLVIQYGSSVKDPISPNDEDYLVLVHGNFFEETHIKEEMGDSQLPTRHLAKPIDIQIRMFDSFLVSLIMGKPYEVSVAFDGEAIDSHQIPRSYWNWLKTLMRNLIVDTEYLSERIQNDIQSYRTQYVKETKGQYAFNLIITAYHLACSYLQIISLKNYVKKVPAEWIYPISKVDYLIELIQNRASRKIFAELIEYFKRNKIPANWREFEHNLDTLFNDLEKEIKNVQ